MYLRTWHGQTKRVDGDAYEIFMHERAAPDYGSIDGLINLYFTRRDEGNISHFLLVTIWDSMDAIKAFAGDDPTKAKYYPEDAQYLLAQDETSFNYDIFHQA
jgi:heme-degrading monooxygenase HmoA